MKVSLGTFLPLLVIILLLQLSVVSSAAAQEAESVELGITELSPRGEAGGYAMPASGESTPGCGANSFGTCYYYTCTYNFSNTVPREGQAVNVRITGTQAGQTASSGNHERDGVVINTHSGAGNVWRNGQTTGLAKGVYAYSYYRQWTTSRLVGRGETAIDGHILRCNRNLRVYGRPDMDPDNLSGVSGSTIAGNHNYGATTVMRNRGNQASGDFSYRFEVDFYRNNTVDQNLTGSSGSMSGGGSRSVSANRTFNMPSGLHRIRVRQTPNVPWESNAANNVSAWHNFRINPGQVPALNYSCAANGTRIDFSWSTPIGTVGNTFAWRFDNQTLNGWSNNCGSMNSGDQCLDITGNSRSVTITPGQTARAWIHARGNNSVLGVAQTQNNISCPAPPPTATLERETNNAGNWTGANLTLGATEVVDVDIRWSSTNSSGCTVSSNSGDSNTFNGWDSKDGAQQGLTAGDDDTVGLPGPGQTWTYTVSCAGTGHPDATDSFTITRSTAPDLVPDNPTKTGGENSAGTKTHTFEGVMRNNGSASSGAFDYQFEIDYAPFGSVDVTIDPANGSSINGGSSLTVTGSQSLDMPDGTHRVRLVQSPAVSNDSDTSNNESGWTSFTIAANASVALSLSDNDVVEGESTSLLWSVEDAVSCTATGDTHGGWSGSQASSDRLPPSVHSRTITPTARGTYTYGISCNATPPGASDSDTVTLTVRGPVCTNPSSLEGDESLIRSGESVELTFSAANEGANCTLSGPGSPGSYNNMLCGETLTVNPTNSATYELQCDDGTRETFRVNVLPEIQET